MGKIQRTIFLSSSLSLLRILILLCGNIFLFIFLFFIFFSFFPFRSPCFVSISFRGRKFQRPNGFGGYLFGPTVFQVLLIYSINSIELLRIVSFHSIFNATFTKEPTFIIVQHVSVQSVLQ